MFVAVNDPTCVSSARLCADTSLWARLRIRSPWCGARDLCRTCSPECWLRKWMCVLHPLFRIFVLGVGTVFLRPLHCQLRVRGRVQESGIFWEMTPGFGFVFSILCGSTAATRLRQCTEAVVFFTRFLCEGGLAPVVHGDCWMNFTIFHDEK